MERFSALHNNLKISFPAAARMGPHHLLLMGTMEYMMDVHLAQLEESFCWNIIHCKFCSWDVSKNYSLLFFKNLVKRKFVKQCIYWSISSELYIFNQKASNILPAYLCSAAWAITICWQHILTRIPEDVFSVIWVHQSISNKYEWRLYSIMYIVIFAKWFHTACIL